MRGVLQAACGLLLGLAAAACGPGPGERLVGDYLRQLEQAGAVPGLADSSIEVSAYPGHRDRTLPLQEIRIGLLGLLDYRRCGMTQLISERNSILGRVMPISQRLLYEIRFLQRAELCHATLAAEDQPDAEFLSQLAGVIAVKRADLAAVFWNATFDSPELAKALSLAASPLVPGEDRGFADSLPALEFFVALAERLGDPTLQLDSASLERQYQRLQAERYGGRLLLTLRLLTGVMEQAVAGLANVEPGPEVCERLLAVYRDTVQPDLQPYLDQVHRQGGDWLGALERLWARQAVTPPAAVADYHARMLSPSSPTGLWQRFERARHHHSRQWRTLEQHCAAKAG